MKKNVLIPFFILTFLLVSNIALANTCEFTRDLKLNDKGKDVQCLQKYLNTTKHLVSLNGAGAKGKETETFGPKTESALILWQIENNITPAQGYFGQKSQEKYKELTKNNKVETVTTNNSNENVTLIASLNKQIESLKMQLSSQSQTETTKGGEEKDSIEKIKKALIMIKEAEDAINESKNKNKAEDIIEDARNDFYKSITYLFENNYSKASKLAIDSFEGAEEAYEEADGGTKENKADEALEDAENKIKKAESKIEKADKNDKDTDDAWELLEEAEEILEEAEDAFDNKDYEDAIKLAEEAEELAEEAIDEI